MRCFFFTLLPLPNETITVFFFPENNSKKLIYPFIVSSPLRGDLTTKFMYTQFVR